MVPRAADPRHDLRGRPTRRPHAGAVHGDRGAPGSRGRGRQRARLRHGPALRAPRQAAGDDRLARGPRSLDAEDRGRSPLRSRRRRRRLRGLRVPDRHRGAGARRRADGLLCAAVGSRPAGDLVHALLGLRVRLPHRQRRLRARAARALATRSSPPRTSGCRRRSPPSCTCCAPTCSKSAPPPTTSAPTPRRSSSSIDAAARSAPASPTCGNDRAPTRPSSSRAASSRVGSSSSSSRRAPI